MSRAAFELAHLVHQDNGLIVLDRQEYLVIGSKILTLRIWFSVDVGNVTMFQESLDFLRLGMLYCSN